MTKTIQQLKAILQFNLQYQSAGEQGKFANVKGTNQEIGLAIRLRLLLMYLFS